MEIEDRGRAAKRSARMRADRFGEPCTVASAGWTVFIGLAAMLVGGAGCQQPERKLVTHPAGTLRVHYEEASAPSSCLVASVTMAANYVAGERRFTEPGLRAALRQRKLDETRVADLKTVLAGQGLDLIVLAGQLDGNPPLGLRFWAVDKGYPVVCVINEQGEDPQFNHAVVVTGFSANAGDPPADIVYYLDPATRDPLQSVGLAEFESRWARCDHTMMIVVEPPAGEADAASRPAGR